MTIKEVLVVEGKNDTKRLQSFFDVDTIETSGSGLTKETLEYIRGVHEKRGVILLLDPDHPGEQVRQRLNDAIPGCRNAFLRKEDARTEKKVGVEHASKEVLEEALSHLLTYEERGETISRSDLYELGLSGKKDSSKKREILEKHYHLGRCSGSSLYRKLNMLQITKEEAEKLL